MSVTQRVPYSKGRRGIVYTALYNGKKIAIKVVNPETEAVNRIQIEAEFLQKLNKYSIGPQFIFFKDNELGMEFVDGELFPEYITHADKNQIIDVIKGVLLQCYQMDVLGINKEEMHHPFKHIIVRDEKPVLIDFERCHYTEKQQNVTQFVQYLTSKKIQEAFEKKHILIDKEKILSLVQAYKKKVDKAALDKIIGTIH